MSVQTLNRPKPTASRKTSDGLGKLTASLLLILCGVIALTPLVWLVAKTVQNKDDIQDYLFFAPFSHWTLYNFNNLFGKTTFTHNLLNSIFVTDITVIMQLFFASLAGFGLAKYEFKGKKIVMLIMLGTMMLPGQVTMAPLYDMLYHMHFVDRFQGLIIPAAVTVFGIFLFKQSISQVPDELLQAARIDGCSEFRIYWDIVMPISRPMIGAFCLMAFMGSWNNFLWPQILLHHDYYFTLPIALNQFNGMYSTAEGSMGILLAGTLLSVLPVMVLFLFLQKEFVAGLTAGAVKG